MIISSILSLGLALTVQASDPTRVPREAFTNCLTRFMTQSVEQHKSASEFQTALPQQCTSEQQAYSEAVRRREAGFRTPAGEIDQIIHDEVEDARTNIQGMFEMSTTPRT